MKKRGVIIGLLLAFGLVLVMGSYSATFAANVSAICTIDKIVQTKTNTKIGVTEEGDAWSKLMVVEPNESLNRMLAIALTAASTDDKIKIYFDSVSLKINSIQLLK